MQSLQTGSYPDRIADMSTAELRRLADLYLQRIRRGAQSGTQRIVDKSIENYREFGFISLLFPAASHVHLKRAPLDCCLSMYMHPLYNLPGLTSSLSAIGCFYRQFARCLEHWMQVAEVPPIQVSYETLVEQPETETRRVLEECGLPWDTACLDYHRSQDLIRTLSYHQASQPIYTHSVGQAEKYRPFLGELLEALGDAA